MGKIVKQHYIKADGTKKTYSYLIPVPKVKIIESGIDTNKDVKIEVVNGKIIISN